MLNQIGRFLNELRQTSVNDIVLENHKTRMTL